MSGDYLGRRAARRFAGTPLWCLVTGFVVSAAAKKYRSVGNVAADCSRHEPVITRHEAGNGAGIHAPLLLALDNARFLATWSSGDSADAARWQSERREKKWSAPSRVGADGGTKRTNANSKQRDAFDLKLDNGMTARIAPAESHGAVSVAVSSDLGITWAETKLLPLEAGVVTGVSGVATRTGLALLYVADGSRLMFWHGSIDRIVDGPPVASSTPTRSCGPALTRASCRRRWIRSSRCAR